MNNRDRDSLIIQGAKINLDDENLEMCSHEEYKEYLKSLKLQKNSSLRLCDVHKSKY
jgi:hypothetical protein